MFSLNRAEDVVVPRCPLESTITPIPLAFWLISLTRIRIGNQAGLLAFVADECADGRAGTGFAPGVRDLGAKKRTQARFDESPRAHVFRFFLTPDELGVFRKWLEHLAQLLFRQWI